MVRPLYSVEVTETETAKFETEISESDIHATWKLKGETLHPSAVRLKTDTLVCLADVILSSNINVFSQDVEIKEEGARHMLILYNCKKDMAGGVDFLAANAKSSAQLRVKGNRNNTLFKVDIQSDESLTLQTLASSYPA